MKERNSKNIVKILKNNGWEHVRTRGSHMLFKHPENNKLITVPHPRKDLPKGTVISIFKAAGIKNDHIDWDS